MPLAQPGTRFTAIAAGNGSSLAVKSDGTVMAWGWNSYGKSTVPRGLNGVIAIAAGVTARLEWRHATATSS